MEKGGFEERNEHTPSGRQGCSNPCFSGAPTPYHVMRFDRRGVLREAMGKWPGVVTAAAFPTHHFRHTSAPHDALCALRAAHSIREPTSEASPSFRKFGVQRGG